LASLVDSSRVRLVQSEDQRMVVEMLPPNLAVSSSIHGQDGGEIHPSLSTSLSELSQPLRVTITFDSTDEKSLSGIQVSAYVFTFAIFSRRH